MKRSAKIILPALAVAGCLAAAWVGPWWAAACFLAIWYMLMRYPARPAAIQGGLILAAVFGVMATILLLRDSTGLLDRTGGLLGGIPATGLLIVTVVIGWITGLLSGWVGSALGQVVFEKK